MSKPIVYLAGPDVFFENPIEQGQKLKKICAKYELEGVFPMDAMIKAVESSVIAFDSDTKTEVGKIAKAIYMANVNFIRSCHGVLANMMPFRGPSTDVGTAWEMGFATALDLPVIGYTRSRLSYEERVKILGREEDCQTESFGLTDNLMLACSVVKIYETFEQAVSEMSRLLYNERK